MNVAIQRIVELSVHWLIASIGKAGGRVCWLRLLRIDAADAPNSLP